MCVPNGSTTVVTSVVAVATEGSQSILVLVAAQRVETGCWVKSQAPVSLVGNELYKLC